MVTKESYVMRPGKTVGHIVQSLRMRDSSDF